MADLPVFGAFVEGCMQAVEQNIDFRCDAECRATVHITSEPWGPRVSWAPMISPDGSDEHDRVRQGARAHRASVTWLGPPPIEASPDIVVTPRVMGGPNGTAVN